MPEVIPRHERRRGWNLTAKAFERLLAVLDPDVERAALAYEALRDRISGLLQWWGALRPDELADETLDRVARRLEEGAVVPRETLGKYVRGVARLVYYESTRDPVIQLDDREVVAPERHDELEPALACLDRCLEQLSAEERAIVLRYYGDGKQSEARQKLVQELGISSTALRIRTHRLRSRLETCVAACLGAQ